MSSFEDDLMYGYTQHTKIFDKWCERASSLLGPVRQCIIKELSRDGRAFHVANAPDIGEQNIINKWYDHVPDWSFYENVAEGITTRTSHFGHENSKIFTEGFNISWFSYREVTDDDTQITYNFVSDTPVIYDKLLQNLPLVKKFLKFFKSETQDIVSHHRERKFNLAAVSENFFKQNADVDKTDREKLNQLLQNIGILNQDTRITPREWQCIKMLEYGKSASKTGDILGISQRTVETHFDRLKTKLKVSSKSEIIETLN